MKTRRHKRDDQVRGSARDMKGSTMHYFDYEKMARKAQIPPEKLEELSRLTRQEFPRDDMMYELHLLRACMAIQAGVLTLEQALRPEPEARH